MKKLFLLAALFAAAAFSSCSKHDGVETPVPPDPVVEPQPLAIAFAEGNSLEFDVNETKTVHYTITGGSDNTVVKAEMQTPDDAYTVETTSTSVTEGMITITANAPETENRVVVSVSDGSQTITAEITVSTNAIPEKDKFAITFAEGNSLEFDVDETKIVHYTITGGSDNTVVKAELQTPDDAYTVETTPTSATEGTIKITANTPETENCVVVSVSDGDRSIAAEIAVSTKPIPEELAIAFAEGNSLQFNVNETKTVHYTITGGSDNTVVTAELQTPDDAYTVKTTPASATEGTIAITAKMPTENCVVVTVSGGNRSIAAEIAVTVTLKASFDGKTAVVVTPGTLAELLANYDTTKITELTVIGNLNDEDVKTLNNLPNLAVLDMEHVNLEKLPVEAFSGKTSLISVKLPKMLKTIGNHAFSGCSGLTSITIPDSVTSIGNHAFNFCSGLTSITIGNSVTSIGGYVFNFCSGLTSITIGNSVTLIGNCAFYGCSSLTSITIPDGVTSIGINAFYSCSSLTSITIPNSVTTIGFGAFSSCSGLTSITIGNSVTLIEAGFGGCDRLSAFYGKFASSDNRYLVIDGELVAFAPAGLTSYTIPDGVTSIGDFAFSSCSRLTSITIPDGVTSIGDYAFYSCSSLTSITIPNSVTSIGTNAFWKCISLTSITIPDSVTSIGKEAFWKCISLTSITIPDSVTSIGREAFSDCSRMTSIYCRAQTPPSLGTDAFNTKLPLYVPTGCKAAYAAANGWKNFATIIETQF